MRRLTGLSVEGLFDRFDYHVTINAGSDADPPFTLITGPNGFGKSTLVRMLAASLTGTFSMLTSIPFRTLQITFSDKTRVRVMKEEEEKSQLTTILDGLPGHGLSHPGQQKKNLRVTATMDGWPKSDFPGSDDWDWSVKADVRWAGEIYDAYGSLLANLFVHPVNLPGIPDAAWRMPERGDDLKTDERRPVSSVIQRGIVNYLSKPALAIGDALLALARSAVTTHRVSVTQLSALRDEFEARFRRARELDSLGLVRLGLKEPEMKAVGVMTKLGSSSRRRDTAGQTLATANAALERENGRVEPVAARLECMRDLLNSYWNPHKVATVTASGLDIKTDRGLTVPEGVLSHGETQLALLFARLLFDDIVGPGGVLAGNVDAPLRLCLIDEPEQGLHLVWQEQFLKSLEMIHRVAPFQLIMATHSPGIICDRWDLTRELARLAVGTTEKARGKRR